MKKLLFIVFSILALGIAFSSCDSSGGSGDDSVFSSEPLSGIFSVSATKKVQFSQGNLYWAGDKFKMEEKQYNVPQNGATVQDHIVHFYWAKTASVAYAKYYSESQHTSDKLFAADSGALAGWDVLSGGDDGEWKYLLEGRYNASDLNGHATVCGVHGHIILPDAWTLPAGCTFTPGIGGGWATNTYDETAWTAMENAGAVFLPAAGERDDYDDGVGDVGNFGGYWSKSLYSLMNAYVLSFASNDISQNFTNRISTAAIRLVMEITE